MGAGGVGAGGAGAGGDPSAESAAPASAGTAADDTAESTSIRRCDDACATADRGASGPATAGSLTTLVAGTSSRSPATALGATEGGGSGGAECATLLAPTSRTVRGSGATGSDDTHPIVRGISGERVRLGIRVGHRAANSFSPSSERVSDFTIIRLRLRTQLLNQRARARWPKSG